MQRPDPRRHQLRGKFTGGIGDVETFYAAIKRYATAEGWEVTFEDGPKAFGEHGPLCSITFGFTEGE